MKIYIYTNMKYNKENFFFQNGEQRKKNSPKKTSSQS